MPQHTDAFSGKVADYAQYRERYDPDVILPLLREWCGLTPQWTVADVGAGTGMVGDIFRANGNPVIAIEPNPEMRGACALLHAHDRGFTVASGTAENTGLRDASVEMVAVGRALHWFDAEPAFAEFRRILKPAGWVVVVACGRAEEGREENHAYVELLRIRAGRDTATEECLKVYHQLPHLFAGGEFHHAKVDSEMRLDWNSLLGLTLSISHTPMPGSAGYAAFESCLRAYFDRYQQNGEITLTTSTWLNAGRFGSQAW